MRGRCVVTITEVDARAKADQARRVDGAGGVEAAAAITVPYTPVRGDTQLNED